MRDVSAEARAAYVERVVGDEPFAVLLADDFIVADGAGVTADLVRAFEATGKSQLSVMKVEGQEISKYGVIVPWAIEGSVLGLIEKPKFEDAPSSLASIGRYVLTPNIFAHIRQLVPGVGQEIQLADAINLMASQGTVASRNLKGLRFDCGQIATFHGAVNVMHEKLLPKKQSKKTRTSKEKNQW